MVMKQNKTSDWRLAFRKIHRHLSYFFAGVICIYAVSGICLNHKRDFNSNISITRSTLQLEGDFPQDGAMLGAETIRAYVEQLPANEDYTRHSLVGDDEVKLFFKGGSSLEVNLGDGQARYEKVRKIPVLAAFNRLHYNPSRWWTWFSDIFAVSLLLITFSGLFLLKGRNGLLGIGGIEFVIGILLPLLFIFVV